jgi:hypothetical protein
MNGERRRLLGAVAAFPFGIGATALLAGCATLGEQEAALASKWLAGGPPPLAVGDRWIHEVVNRYNGSITDRIETTVVETGPLARLRVVSLSSGRVSEERQPDAWSVLAESTFDLPITFESPMPLVPSDPGGRSLLSRTHYRAEGHSDRLPWEQQLWLDRVESVSVPAGRFECLRIVRMIRFRHPDIFRLHPERTDVLWYAPAARRWVQREWTGSYMPGTPTRWAGRNRDDWVLYRLEAFALAN